MIRSHLAFFLLTTLSFTSTAGIYLNEIPDYEYSKKNQKKIKKNKSEQSRLGYLACQY
jgi:hypothetical protein